MRTCVTGGAGFIGSNLVDRLVADGHEVTVLDNLSTGSRENLASAGDAVRLLVGDLRDPAAVAEAVDGADALFHLAALAAVARSVDNPREVTEVNVGGTVDLLIAARDAGCRRVVFASSSSVYGDTPVLPKIETMPLSPRSPYAATKAAGEAYVQSFSYAFGMEGVSLRFFNVYGPRQSPNSQYAAVVPLFIDSMSAGRSPVIHGDGGQTRDFTYVRDVVDAITRAATAPNVAGEVMNVGGGGRRVSILTLASVIADVVGYTGDPVHEDARVGDVRDSLADIGRARELLGWDPRTDLEDGIAELVAATNTAGHAH